MDSSSNNDSNNDYVNQSEMSNPRPEDEGLPTVTDRNVSEHGHGIFLHRNIRRRLEDRRFNTDNLPNSSTTGPRETTSLQDNVMANHVWDSPPSSSYFYGGESSRQALNGNGNDDGNMNLNPCLISDINSWNGNNQTLMDIYIAAMGHIPALQPIYGALATLHPSIADNVPEWVESAADPGFGVPMAMELLTGGQQQVENFLFMGESTREMVPDHSLILDFGPDSSDEDEDEVPDAYGHMRIDVEGMTYEELLDLGDNIGTVDTGLPVEVILVHLRRQTYKFLNLEPPVGDDLCCICQENYAEDDDLGQLDCGHTFHFECIKQWLVLKNVCPICKMKALSV